MEESKNPSLKAHGGWVIGSDSWLKIIVEKWIDVSSPELSRNETVMKPFISVDKIEEIVCHKFNSSPEDSKKRGYKNVSRMVMIYLSINYCGLSLREVGDRYGVQSSSGVNKAVSRFRERLLNEKPLNAMIK